MGVIPVICGGFGIFVKGRNIQRGTAAVADGGEAALFAAQVIGEHINKNVCFAGLRPGVVQQKYSVTGGLFQEDAGLLSGEEGEKV